MNGLILHLQGPMMSFADTGFGQLREAGPFPSRSSVLGIIAAALGIPRGGSDLLRLHAGLRVHVATVRAGTLGIDYHTVKPSEYAEPDELFQRRTPPDVNAVQTYRGYHQDAHFVALVEGSDVGLVEECRSALLDPVYVPFLGRRSCPPSTPLRAEATGDGNLVEVLRAAALRGLERRARRPRESGQPTGFTAYIDAERYDAAPDGTREVLRSYRRDLLVGLPRTYVNRPFVQIHMDVPQPDAPSSTMSNEEYFDAAS
jgi:CRISPR system Cascade subunit CasD